MSRKVNQAKQIECVEEEIAEPKVTNEARIMANDGGYLKKK